MTGWPTGSQSAQPALYVWLGASLEDLPDWLSCTDRHCIGGLGDMVAVYDLSPLSHDVDVPFDVPDPEGALRRAGLPAGEARQLLGGS